MNLLLVNLLLLVLYTYLGYFLLVLVLAWIIRKKVHKADIEPHVTLLIAAYNEELAIAKKIEEGLALEYPREKLRIIVASDGSTDRTDDIVRSYASRGVELMRVEGRVGKTECRNVVLNSIKSEVVLFSDATTVYKKDVIRKIVRNFADPEVGMVTGHLVYQSPGKSVMGPGQILYWKYESLIKRAQTAMGTLTGSVGCLTAFRKELYCPLPGNIIEDFTGPLMIVMNGKRVVYEEEAICFEETTSRTRQEWDMRVRVIRGGMKGMLFARKILNPLVYPVASFQLLSHKILRWLVPIFLLVIFVLTNYQYAQGHQDDLTLLLFWGQILFYGMGLLSWVIGPLGMRTSLAAIPLYFIVLNAASLVALIKTLTFDLESTWETQREM